MTSRQGDRCSIKKCSVYCSLLTLFFCCIQYGGARSFGDQTETALDQIDSQYHWLVLAANNNDYYQPYRNYPDWVVYKNARQQRRERRELIREIVFYSARQQQWVTYERIHTFWASRQANSYAVMLDSRNQRTIEKVLKIYWTMDESNVADNIRMIIINEQGRRRSPAFPRFVEASSHLPLSTRLRIIRNTIQDAFDYWSSILCHHVVFEYQDYSYLRSSANFSDVIVIAMRNISHVDEHTNLTESFDSVYVVAHAAVNFIHLNGQTAAFYVAPHLRSSSVYVQQESVHRRIRHRSIKQITSEQLAQRYQLPNYQTLYQYNKNIIYQLAGTKEFTAPGDLVYQCLECIILHEIGHVLGLGHAADDVEGSLMRGFTVANEPLLSEEDQIIMRNIYTPFLMSVERKTPWENCY